MPTKKSNYAKVTAWTRATASSDALRMDFDGTLSACAIQLFEMAPAQGREKALALMQVAHARLTEEGR